MKTEIVKFIKKHTNKSGIIYCLEKKKAEEVSELLNLNNIKSLPYHAGIESKNKNGNTRCIFNGTH